MRVPPLVRLCFFPGVLVSSRVAGACPVTTDMIMRVNVITTTPGRANFTRWGVLGRYVLFDACYKYLGVWSCGGVFRNFDGTPCFFQPCVFVAFVLSLWAWRKLGIRRKGEEGSRRIIPTPSLQVSAARELQASCIGFRFRFPLHFPLFRCVIKVFE